MLVLSSLRLLRIVFQVVEFITLAGQVVGQQLVAAVHQPAILPKRKGIGLLRVAKFSVKRGFRLVPSTG